MRIKKDSPLYKKVFIFIGISCLTFPVPLQAMDYEDEKTCVTPKKESMTTCLENHLKKLKTKHNSLKKLVAQQMVELDEATLREDAEKAYQESERTFRNFMRKNCGWYAARSLGEAEGRQNALRCEIRLLQLRLEELRSTLGH